MWMETMGHLDVSMRRMKRKQKGRSAKCQTARTLPNSVPNIWTNSTEFVPDGQTLSLLEILTDNTRTLIFGLLTIIVKLRSRSSSPVRSRSGPRLGPEGPRTKDQRTGPGLTLNLVCHHHSPLTTSKLFLGRR